MILRLVAIMAAGAFAASCMRKTRKRNAAYAPDQPHESYLDIRDAGPDAMRDAPRREWTEIDEDLDESFPASDPPGGY
ncbi:hypothetical protein GRI69_07545 [Erythrobacter vulgaris]|uniref:Lipoprotein n=1 Tax=Qipengyuania vulgaris TaxID=291985 RepID=A0A844XS83_9SPHN|nr:hypothetical protein [Qipengyuania vulgaris]